MSSFHKVLAASVFFFMAGNVTAETPPAIRAGTIQQIKPSASQPAPAATRIAPAVNPSALAPQKVVDTETQVQDEIKRLKKQRDDIVNATAKVGASFSKLTFTPVTGNSCVSDDRTWNSRSGESFACAGATTCNARAGRWSKNRFNPCEPGVVIDSCVTSNECKAGSVCDTSKSICVRV